MNETNQDSQETNPSEHPPDPNRGQRRIRNILIDKGIQLRLTFTSMLIILLMCSALAAVLTWQHADSKRFFDEQRMKSKKLFQRQLNENTKLIYSIRKQSTKDMQKLLQTATGMLDVQLKDKDPDTREMARLAKDALLQDDAARIKRRQRLNARLMARRRHMDKEDLDLRKHQDLEASMLESGQFTLTIASLVLFGVLMLVLIFVFSLRMTHRVAGPLFKIGRYFDEVRDGKLSEVHDLRKTDLLQSFHERFKQMHHALKTRAAQDVQVLEAIQSLCEEHKLTGETVEQLQAILEEKRQSLSSDS